MVFNFALNDDEPNNAQQNIIPHFKIKKSLSTITHRDKRIHKIISNKRSRVIQIIFGFYQTIPCKTNGRVKT